MRFISIVSLILIIFFSCCHDGRSKSEEIDFQEENLSLLLKRLAGMLLRTGGSELFDTVKIFHSS